MAAMTQLVLTAVGDDREGLISALSLAVAENGGNWLDGQFARLAGKFAGVVLVDVPDKGEVPFREAVAGLESSVGWRVEVTDIAQTGGPEVHTPAAAAPMQLRLLGQDRPGMVREVSKALAAQHVTIDEFRSWTSDAPEGGGVLFEADATVRIGEGGDESALREALEKIASELMVDLDLDADGAEFGERP